MCTVRVRGLWCLDPCSYHHHYLATCSAIHHRYHHPLPPPPLCLGLFSGLLISASLSGRLCLPPSIKLQAPLCGFSHFALPSTQTQRKLIQVDYYGLDRQLKLTSACCHKRHILVFSLHLTLTQRSNFVFEGVIGCLSRGFWWPNRAERVSLFGPGACAHFDTLAIIPAFFVLPPQPSSHAQKQMNSKVRRSTLIALPSGNENPS